MKLHMKLRTRLFLGFSALMTVALLGLMLALVSVMQMAKSQERLIGDNFTAIELNQQMRHALGNMLLGRMHAETDVALLEREQAKFEALLEQRLGESTSAEQERDLREISAAFARFVEQLTVPHSADWTTADDQALGDAFSAVRERLLEVQNRAYQHIREMEEHSRDRAILLAGVLGLTGVAVLLIGFITAHGFARRFAATSTLPCRARRSPSCPR